MATIWLVRAYTPPLSADGSETDRHHHFARALIEQGHRVVLITSAVARWSGRSRIELDNADYVDETDVELIVRIVRERPYGSVLERFISMIHFERMVLRSTRGLPDPDLIMGTSVHPFAAHAGERLAKRYRVPFMLEIGDIWPRTLAELGSVSRRHPGYWLLRVLEIWLYRKAARILSKLPFGKNHVAASHADPAKVVYLPNGVDITPYLQPNYPPAPISQERFVVAFTGGLTPVYGLENLLKAARIVGERHPDWPIEFWLVGSGRSKPALQQYAADLGLSNVEFRERVPANEVPGILAEADACIAIARDIGVVRDFGMSHNKVYEYLGAARPIIFSVASANDPVTDSGSGVSVPPEDAAAIAEAVAQLYEMTRNDRIEMGRRAQAFVRQGYTLAAVSDRFVSIVEEALEQLPPGTAVDRDNLSS